MGARLRELATGKGQLEPRLAEVAALHYEQVAPDAVIRHGLQSLTGLPRLLESGTLEERKDLVRAFFEGISVKRGEGQLVDQMKKLPARGKLLPGAVSVAVGSGGTLLSRKDINGAA